MPENNVFGESSDPDAIAETVFTESVGLNGMQSANQFNIYDFLNKGKQQENTKVSDDSISRENPPGFTPKEDDKELDHVDDNISEPKEDLQEDKDVNSTCSKLKSNSLNSGCSGHFKVSNVPKSGGSILNYMKELVKVSQTIGYKMEGCLGQKAKTDWIRELCVKHRVNILALQETKMENIEVFTIKSCWGNFAFEFVHSDSVGNLRGILCTWDPNCLCKSCSTVSDYFVIVRGVWLKTNIDILLVVVYAPHDRREKRMLWDYLSMVVNNWEGKVIMMGDFNEVRLQSDRFGLVFHARDVKVFNSFILNAGLAEVPLGGSAYTWEWNFGHISSSRVEMKHLQEELNRLDTEIESGKVMDVTSSKRMEVINSMHNINKTHAIESLQKAKIKWAVEGDENSHFFHGILNKRRKQMSIRGVMKDGVWLDKPDQVKEEFLNHFRDRFARPVENRVSFDMEFLNSLSRAQQKELESIVTREEIKRADLVEKDVILAVNYFFKHGEFSSGCNSSFIALIPKIPNANMVKDFRPISLIGRQIMDGPFILNEIMHWCSSKKKQALIFKVDFEKAYDSVRWDFLDEALQKFGFGTKWRLWIQSCLRSSKSSI
nr:RNA-directed DNA polymerase, eukaryota [Tanacetum cinerariifolium]